MNTPNKQPTTSTASTDARSNSVPTPPLRIGIIGAGWPGERHADGYRACDQADLVAISDLSPKRRAAFAERYTVPRTYGEYHELLADPEIDAVSIALPNFLHEPATIAALEAGKHVLCEKPPATTLADARAMADAAERANLVLAYALQRRFMPATRALCQELAKKKLGDVYHARAVWTRTWGVPQGEGGWFTDPERSGGGPLIDIGVHMLDLAWFLMGCPTPRTVSAQTYNKFPALTRTEDSAFGLIRFADGHSLQLEASWVLAQDTDQMGVHLYGTDGGARVDDHHLDLFSIGKEGRTRTAPMVEKDVLKASFGAEIADFVDAILNDRPPCTTAAQGTQLMAMIEAMYRSSKEAREVTIAEVQEGMA